MFGASKTVAALVVVGVTLGPACTREGASDGPAPVQDAPPDQNLAQEPEVVLPDAAPASLQVTAIAEGDGEVAVAGDTTMVHMVVYALSTGTKVDSTWTLDAPRRVELSDGAAIPGFIQGVEGMRVGGRRYLVVPPDLAYGESGAPPLVGPGETLVLVVDLLGVEREG